MVKTNPASDIMIIGNENGTVNIRVEMLVAYED